MNKKKIIIVIIAIFVIGFGIYKYFGVSTEQDFEFELVKRGTVKQTVLETGVVESSEKVDLSFKNSGVIKTMYVSVGDNISKGDRVGQLDTTDLLIELNSTKAALDIVQAQYDKLIAGASKEEIKVAQTNVLSAEVSLANAEQNLKDVSVDANEDINQAYEDAFSGLDDAHLKLYNAYNTVKEIQRTYFTYNDQEGIKMINDKDSIKNALDWAESAIGVAKNNKHESINTALDTVNNSLKDSKSALTSIRNTTDIGAYRDKVSSADKTSIDNHRSYINTAYTAIVDAQQTISLTNVTNKKNINTAEDSVSSAQISLAKVQDELTLLKVEPRKEDVSLYSAKVNQAKADMDRINNKINEATLVFYRGGQVIEVYKREGEAVKQFEPVISFLPEGPFQIKVDIYEEDIVNVDTNDQAIINLVAFPNQLISGSITAIEPAEKLIEGVVYYETTINFKQTPAGIKLGMTADIEIIVNKKENVMVIPKDAARQKEGKTVVRTLKDGVVREQIIQTGLAGDEFIEVVSGLSEGEEIIVD